MLKIDIISGFLGAGKTTFIKRLLDTNLSNEKVVLIENEYGEVSIDSDILGDAKIDIRELSQGCICCSLVGDFSKSLQEVINTYNPDRILIEPSGVGKLSDIVKAVASAGLQENVNSLVCLVDAKKAKMYEKNFGEFFVDQIENAHTVILSRTDVAKEEVIGVAVEIIRKHNSECVVVTTPIAQLTDEDLVKAYEGVHEDLFEGIDVDHLHEDGECDDPDCCCHHHHHHDDEDEEHEHHHHHHHHDHDEEEEEECCGHHHHDDEDEEHEHHHHHHHHDHDEEEEEECCCHHHHDDEDEEHEHHHHHHHHDHDEDEEEECCCHHHHDDEDEEHEHHHHHHHHDHDEEEEECCCGHHHDHDHEHHHHHHADEVFSSFGIETSKKYDLEALKALLDEIAEGHYGMIVRSKGIIQATDGNWYVFNLTPEEVSVEPSRALPMGKIVVIGSHVDEAKIKALF